ncbi:hypothetical protein EN780_36630, partial [Mesorhizobium sp. M4B.F.Ca.ET.089.01.1.1]|uniref:hypothetical protein n=1 Tax=Mesorhizobium sp. M4B.F.Ca.ET.089.01.1.1 TaxID=2496662 RepID=UPI000FF181DA
MNDWLQLEFRLICLPTVEEDADFWREVSALAEEMRALDTNLAWFFLHKHPGLKLRVRAVGAREEILSIVDRFGSRRRSWLEFLSYGSYFDQAGLLPHAFRRSIDRVLTASAVAYLAAPVIEEDVVTCWSRFATRFLSHFEADPWIVWELLSRFQQFNTTRFYPQSFVRTRSTRDPSALLPALPVSAERGFAASPALLQ